MNTLALKRLRPQTLRATSAKRSAFAIALALGLSAASVLAQGYYPDPNSPVAGNLDLQMIQDKLHTFAPTKTLIVPPPTGFELATDKELAAATALVVEEEVTSDIAGVTVASLVREASQWLPSKAASVIKNVAATLAAIPGTSQSAAQLEANLEAATFEASKALPKGAPAVAGAAIKAITAIGDNVDADNIAEQAIIASSALAAKITTAAIAGALKGGDSQTLAITTTVVTAAINNGAGYLVEEITYAAVRAAKTTATTTEVTQAALSAANAAIAALAPPMQPPTVAAAIKRATTIEIVAAAASALPTSSAADVKAAVSMGDVNKTAADTAVDAYVAVRDANPTDTTAAVAAVNAYLATAPANHEDAVAAGAVVGYLRYSPDVLGTVISYATSHASTVGTADITESGVRAYPKAAAKLTTASVLAAPNEPSEAVLGAIKAAPPILAQAVITAGLKAAIAVGGSDVTEANDIVTKSINAVQASGNPNEIGAITLGAVKANKALSKEIVQAAVQAIDISTNATYVGAAVAAGIVGDKKNVTAIIDGAKTQRLDDNDNYIDQAGALASRILNGDPVVGSPGKFTKVSFYTAVEEALAAATNANEVLIVTNAGTRANPKGAQAIAAASAVASPASAAAIVTAAAGANYKAQPNIQIAVDTAVHVAASTSDLFEYVADLVFTNQAFAVDIATGATAAAPQYSHVTAHAAAFRAPKAAGKSVAAIFAYSRVDTALVTDKPAAAAAITAGATVGILEANLDGAKTGTDRKKEIAAVKGAVASAVKAALKLTGPNISQIDAAGNATSQPSQGSAGVVTGYIAQVTQSGDTDIPLAVQAVLTAAGKAAKAYILEIAQAAATAGATVSDAPSLYSGAGIVTALANIAKGLTNAQIQAAVDFGKSQAVAMIPGAGAAGINNYGHSSGTGAPVTSIFGL